MYSEIESWLDNVLNTEIPDDTKGFIFNLYDDGDDNWSMEVVATSRFDENDPDWGCDEIDDFGTRDEPFSWEEQAGWETIQDKCSEIIAEYLSNGEYSGVLKKAEGVGVGFVDGDLEIIYTRD
ncbi:MAG: hypothetical protein IJH64_11100 [Oscillospiraceae bacterium]|nr:hypothetical protein [Oscillospiraceae bacterium]MBR0450698.1 hypothetical protein [Oscillospiraceae bacterium]